MNKDYVIQVFGKSGCQKCKILNQRIDSVLEKEAWADFEKVYIDIETEDGLVQFSNAECINPQRIPAMLVVKRIDGKYRPLVNAAPERADKVCKSSKLYTFLGLQTDYSSNGVITPQMITSILAEAMKA